ncbi:galactosyldiacylglycerol synthase [Streptomyces sp. NPDC052077]|uniref:MGDG synthase family glycosyltransferase n=1 Tax=Streptomyces sp. NPDC052077 TaxID=3154757 RepID=UPI003420D339
MGAGHDTVAAEVARRAREGGGDALVTDVLALLPFGLGRALRFLYRGSVRHAPWAYGAVYRLFLRPGPGRRPGGTPLARLAGGRLLRLAAAWEADAVVPVFHLGAQLTGHLRARGLLPVPSVVLVVDFAVHRQWLHPGNDHYLCLTPDAAREVRRAIGAPATVCGPVVPPGFLAVDAGAAGAGAGAPTASAGPALALVAAPDAPDASDASDAPGFGGSDGDGGTAPGAGRSAGQSADPGGGPGSGGPGDTWRLFLGRHGPGRVPVVLSAGAWGVGSRLDATVGLLAAHGYLAVVLCGANDRLRGELSGTPGVLALGWVGDMPGLLRAARALIDNAAGQTAVQALAAGLPVIGHRPIPGHGADGVRRMADLGVSDLAGNGAALLASLRRLTAPGPEREARTAAGRALFRDDPVPLMTAYARARRAGTGG